MPNQNNFRTDLSQQNTSEPLTYVSRIIRFPDEGILLEQLPGSIGYNLGDNVEIHFYTTQGNVLLLSVVADVRDTSIFKFHIVTYNDGTFQTYLRIDFTQLFETKNVTLLPGDYKMVMNFFSDEIGSYYNHKLYITEISPSRTEIQMGFIDNITPEKITENKKLMKEFVERGFDKFTALGFTKLILETSFIENNEDDGITFQNLLGEDNIQRMQNMNPNYPSMYINGLREFMQRVYNSTEQKIIQFPEERLQRDELLQFVSSSIHENAGVLSGQLPQLTAIRV